jgi:hypothetical protein
MTTQHNISKRLRLVLSKDSTEGVSPSPQLEMETDPLADMLCFLVI